MTLKNDKIKKKLHKKILNTESRFKSCICYFYNNSQFQLRSKISTIKYIQEHFLQTEITEPMKKYM